MILHTHTYVHVDNKFIFTSVDIYSVGNEIRLFRVDLVLCRVVA